MGSKSENGCLELSFPATEAQASLGIAALSDGLSARGLPESRRDDVRIALAEAINNVVEHAYAGTAAAEIQVSCHLCKDVLEILISDCGKPLPDLRVPEGDPPSVETERSDLPEGGFGWFLIRQLVSEICYRRAEGRNYLRLRFSFDDVT